MLEVRGRRPVLPFVGVVHDLTGVIGTIAFVPSCAVPKFAFASVVGSRPFIFAAVAYRDLLR